MRNGPSPFPRLPGGDAAEGLSVAESAFGQDVLAQEAEGMVTTQQAIGVSLGEALGNAAAALGDGAARAPWDAFLAQVPSSQDILEVLDGLAAVAPRLAEAWFHDALAAGTMKEWRDPNWDLGLILEGYPWITTLPAGLAVKGDLILCDCGALTRLPSGLRIGGWLDLRGCAALTTLPKDVRIGDGLELADCRSLHRLPAGLQVPGRLVLSSCTSLKRIPQGLRVGGDVSLVDCPLWDGAIPDDVEVAGYIVTDRHPYPGIPFPEWRKLHPQGELG